MQTETPTEEQANATVATPEDDTRDLSESPAEAEDAQAIDEDAIDDATDVGSETSDEQTDEAEAGDEPDAEETIAELRRRLDKEAAHRQECHELAEECRELEDRHDRLKKSTSEAKRDLDTKREELTKLTLEGPWAGPLFENVQSSDEPEANGDQPADESAWREVPVGDLVDHGAPKAALEKLMEKVPGPIKTLGELSDFMGGQYSRLTDIEGIGKVGAEKIEAAMSQWFIANPNLCPPVKSQVDTKPELAWTEYPGTDDLPCWRAASPAVSAGEDGDFLYWIKSESQDGPYKLTASDELDLDDIAPFGDLDAAKAEAESCDNGWWKFTRDERMAAKREAEAEGDEDDDADPDLSETPVDESDPLNRQLQGFISQGIVEAFCEIFEDDGGVIQADDAIVNDWIVLFEGMSRETIVAKLKAKGAMEAQCDQAIDRIANLTSN